MKILMLASLVACSVLSLPAAEGHAQLQYDAVAGTAYDLIEEGPAGELAIVATSPVEAMESGELLVILRNNTDISLVDIEVGATIRDDEDALVAVGAQSTLAPRLIGTGGLALVTLDFQDATIPTTYDIEFTVEGQPLGNDAFRIFRDLDVLETRFVDNRIVGIMTNSYDIPVVGPFGMSAFCFGSNGDLQSRAFAEANGMRVEPGADIAFQVHLTGEQQSEEGCGNHLIAGFGYAEP